MKMKIITCISLIGLAILFFIGTYNGVEIDNNAEYVIHVTGTVGKILEVYNLPEPAGKSHLVEYTIPDGSVFKSCWLQDSVPKLTNRNHPILISNSGKRAYYLRSFPGDEVGNTLLLVTYRVDCGIIMYDIFRDTEISNLDEIKDKLHPIYKKPG